MGGERAKGHLFRKDAYHQEETKKRSTQERGQQGYSTPTAKDHGSGCSVQKGKEQESGRIIRSETKQRFNFKKEEGVGIEKITQARVG